ncbi:hypothetical protein [Mesorhizobium helmanticense]|uniref:hypothetical protein n=1 Tax=Mesorhizobium helmanticense TaxID=1776423 RepID=UPI0011B242E6|nr:hypothetical protein [Mesorhizobium helmanticense]
MQGFPGKIEPLSQPGIEEDSCLDRRRFARSAEKMAGLECGPAKKEGLQPSEGNTVQRNGRKPPNDFTCMS